MNETRYKNDLESFYAKWETQDEIPFDVTDPRHEYINQFIDMVNEIELAHGYKIDAVSYTHPPSPRDRTRSRMPSSA